MAAISVNDAGTWRTPSQVYVNDAGTWRNIQQIYVNDAGTWRTVFQYLLLDTTITEGTDGTDAGYASGSYGSIGSATLNDGKTLSFIANNTVDSFIGSVRITGFSSNPGASYFTKVTVAGLDFFSSTASFSYGGGTAQWDWAGGFGLDGSGSSTLTITP